MSRMHLPRFTAPRRTLVLPLALSLGGCAAGTAREAIHAGEAMPGAARGQPGVQVTSVLAEGLTLPDVELRQVTGTGYEVTHIGGRRGEAGVLHSVAVGERVCTLPCSAAVDDQAELFFGAPGAPSSKTFRLREPGGLLFTVRPGDEDQRKVGITLATLGGISSFVGLIAAPVGAGVQADGFLKLGVGTLVTGAVLLAIGIPVAISGNTTFVRSTSPPGAVALSW
jgi:hypothetical protein